MKYFLKFAPRKMRWILILFKELDSDHDLFFYYSRVMRFVIFILPVSLVLFACAVQSTQADSKIPFEITNNKSSLEKPIDLFNSKNTFNSRKKTVRGNIVGSSIVSGHIQSSHLTENSIKMIFTIDSAQYSKNSQIVVNEKLAREILGNYSLELVVNLDAQSVSQKKGFDVLLSKIEKSSANKDQQDVLIGFISSIAEDPFSYLGFSPFKSTDLVGKHPGDHWALSKTINGLNIPMDQSFLGWTRVDKENFSVFESKTEQSQNLMQDGTSIPMKFKVQTYVLVRSDWKKREVQFSHEQSVGGTAKMPAQNGTSSFTLTVETVNK